MEFVRDTVRSGEPLLVAVGFCQKPLRHDDQPYQCPAGRPNHICTLIERMTMPKDLESGLPPACEICPIRLYSILALRAAAHIYIMTSAKDIAEDILLPTLKQGKFARGIFILCPYSHRPFAWAALVCGIWGVLVRYAQGDCRNYAMWRAADRGVKNEQTSLAPEAMRRVLALLTLAADERAKIGLPAGRRFERVGNIYTAKMSGGEVSVQTTRHAAGP